MRPQSQLQLAPAIVALAAFAIGSSAAIAHPGHEEEAPAGRVLAQAGQTAGTPAAQNEVSITVEGDFRVIKANGWPDHAPGAFPRRGNPNTLTPQSYEFH